MNIIKGYIFTYLYLFIILFGVGFLPVKEETSRKIIHVLTGFSYFIMARYFNASIHLIIPPLTFVFINYLATKKDIIKGMERTNYHTYGTVFYALSFTILAFISHLKKDFLPYYGLGVLTMALADGFAPFISMKFNYKIKNTYKTYSAFVFIFFATLFITIAFNNMYSLSLSIFDISIVSIASPFLEFIGRNGYDNLTLPLGVALLAYIL